MKRWMRRSTLLLFSSPLSIRSSPLESGTIATVAEFLLLPLGYCFAFYEVHDSFSFHRTGASLIIKRSTPHHATCQLRGKRGSLSLDRLEK